MTQVAHKPAEGPGLSFSPQRGLGPSQKAGAAAAATGASAQPNLLTEASDSPAALSSAPGGGCEGHRALEADLGQSD